MRLYAAASRVVSLAVQDLLPSTAYTGLVRLNRRFGHQFFNAGAEEQTEALTHDDRSWVGSYYQDDVEALRKITGIALGQWERDFPFQVA